MLTSYLQKHKAAFINGLNKSVISSAAATFSLPVSGDLVLGTNVPSVQTTATLSEYPNKCYTRQLRLTGMNVKFHFLPYPVNSSYNYPVQEAPVQLQAAIFNQTSPGDLATLLTATTTPWLLARTNYAGQSVKDILSAYNVPLARPELMNCTLVEPFAKSTVPLLTNYSSRHESRAIDRYYPLDCPLIIPETYGADETVSLMQMVGKIPVLQFVFGSQTASATPADAAVRGTLQYTIQYFYVNEGEFLFE